jgi:hypothetical protein
MRKPSTRCLSNRVSLFRFMPVQDDDAGVAANPYGAAFATSVPCSVQPADPERFLDNDTARLTEKTMYDVMFRDNYSLKADDKIVWVDELGVSHELIVHGNADQAGRGAAFVVSCEEKT